MTDNRSSREQAFNTPTPEIERALSGNVPTSGYSHVAGTEIKVTPEFCPVCKEVVTPDNLSKHLKCVKVTCPDCSDTGEKSPDVPCDTCKATGQLGALEDIWKGEVKFVVAKEPHPDSVERKETNGQVPKETSSD